MAERLVPARDLAAVILGGLVGAGLRLAIDAAFPHGSFPLPTLVINTVGAFLLGMLVARVWHRAPSWLRSGLGTGLLGSFTTFSAVAVSVVSLASTGEGMLALGYLAATVVLGLGAAAAGLSLGRGGSGSRSASGLGSGSGSSASSFGEMSRMASSPQPKSPFASAHEPAQESLP